MGSISITPEHNEQVANATVAAWQKIDDLLDEKATIEDVRRACGEAIALAERLAVAVDREYPGKSASAAVKAAWLKRKAEYKGQTATTRAMLRPMLERAEAFARGELAKYDRERDAIESSPKRQSAMRRCVAEIERREARIGGKLPDGVVNEIRRSYLGE